MRVLSMAPSRLLWAWPGDSHLTSQPPVLSLRKRPCLIAARQWWIARAHRGAPRCN